MNTENRRISFFVLLGLCILDIGLELKLYIPGTVLSVVLRCLIFVSIRQQVLIWLFFFVVVVVCRWNWSVKSAGKSSLWFLSVLVFVSPVGRHSLLYISVGTTACAINGIV